MRKTSIHLILIEMMFYGAHTIFDDSYNKVPIDCHFLFQMQ